MSGGIGDYLRERGRAVDQPVDDALDLATVVRIEELHSASLKAEAERRFAPLKGWRGQEPTEAELADEAFLNEQGFASYNDFRLRIRRSAVGPPGGADHAGGAEAGHDPGPSAEAPGAATAVRAGAPASEAPAASEGPLPGPVALPLQTGPFWAALKRELDGYLAFHVEMADARAAEVLDDASRQAAEMLASATRCLEESESLSWDAAALVERLGAVIESVLSPLAENRAAVEATMAELRDCALRSSTLAPSPDGLTTA